MNALTLLLLAASPYGQIGVPNPVIIPPPNVPIAFSHASHMKLGVKCVQCHPGGYESTESADNILPKEEICTKCHRLDVPNPEKAFPRSSCATCHPGFVEGQGDPEPVIVPAPSIKFPHRSHTILGIVCTDCHKGVEESTSPSWEHIPLMGKCVECHDGKWGPSACATCHLTTGNGILQKKLPQGALKPTGRFFNDDHYDPAWIFRHRTLAAGDEALCRSCHAEAECLDCHAGTTKPAFHPGNYSLLHAKEAYTDGGTCDACHRRERDCKSCHTRLGLTVADAGPRVGRVHPDGWASFSPGGNHHGSYARRSASGCAACHAEADCLTCHSTDTLRVNPHPPGWSGSDIEKRNAAACRKCHL